MYIKYYALHEIKTACFFQVTMSTTACVSAPTGRPRPGCARRPAPRTAASRPGSPGRPAVTPVVPIVTRSGPGGSPTWPCTGGPPAPHRPTRTVSQHFLGGISLRLPLIACLHICMYYLDTPPPHLPTPTPTSNHHRSHHQQFVLHIKM